MLSKSIELLKLVEFSVAVSNTLFESGNPVNCGVMLIKSFVGSATEGIVIA